MKGKDHKIFNEDIIFYCSFFLSPLQSLHGAEKLKTKKKETMKRKTVRENFPSLKILMIT
jgi:hypothetical protein